MGSWENLTGQKIHQLTFLEYKGKSKWLCRCDCGNETEINVSNVKSGLTKACGCLIGNNLERDRPAVVRNRVDKNFDEITGIFTCARHGETNWYHHGGGRKECRLCNQIIQNDRRKLLKKLAVEHKGGKCSKCGYDKCYDALDFHHTDPAIKDGLVSRLLNTSWERILPEINKCELLCANCHREIHSK